MNTLLHFLLCQPMPWPQERIQYYTNPKTCIVQVLIAMKGRPVATGGRGHSGAVPLNFFVPSQMIKLGKLINFANACFQSV